MDINNYCPRLEKAFSREGIRNSSVVTHPIILNRTKRPSCRPFFGRRDGIHKPHNERIAAKL
jgi:hypothetical protein